MPITTSDILDLIALTTAGLEDYFVVADIPTIAGVEPALKKVSVRAVMEAFATNRWHVSGGAPAAGVGTTGDFAFDRLVGMIYEKQAGAWAAIGTIRGPQGDAGVQGAAGPVGPSPAVRWAATALEVQNPDGSWQVPVDLMGAPGKDGAEWLGDVRAPDQIEGRDGDFYLNFVNGDVFRKGAGAWSLVTNIKGSKWIFGDGVPTQASAGAKYDYYLDRLSSHVWYHDPVSEAWEMTGIALRPTHVHVGTGAPNATLGAENDAYFDTGAGTIYKKVRLPDNTESWDGPYLFSPPLTALNVAYDYAQFPALDSVEEALDQLFAEVYYVTPQITSLSTDKASVYEVGRSVANVLVSWALNKAVTTLSLTDAPELTVADTQRLFPGPYAANKTWTLTVGDGREQAVRSVSTLFRHRRYWGTSADASLADLFLLASNEFGASRQQTRSMDGGGAYLYFAYPASFGAASFRVNGLDNTAWTETLVNHTNASGHTESYRVYRTNTVQNGTGISVELL